MVLNDDAMNALENQIYAAAEKAAVMNDSVPDGQIEGRPYINPENGRKEVHFFGQEHFVKAMMPPRKRARLVTMREIAGLQREGVWK